MNDPGVLDLTIYRGDDYAHELRFVDDSDSPAALNLTTYSFKAQIRPISGNSTVLLAEFTIDDTQASLGIIVLYLNSLQTDIPPGYWDLEVNYGTFKKTWLAGRVIVDGDVTKE